MEVIEAFQSGQMSQRQITRKYGIRSPTMLAWQKDMAEKLPENGRKTPEQEIVELKAALRTTLTTWTINRRNMGKMSLNSCRTTKKARRNSSQSKGNLQAFRA